MWRITSGIFSGYLESYGLLAISKRNKIFTTISENLKT